MGTVYQRNKTSCMSFITLWWRTETKQDRPRCLVVASFFDASLGCFALDVSNFGSYRSLTLTLGVPGNESTMTGEAGQSNEGLVLSVSEVVLCVGWKRQTCQGVTPSSARSQRAACLGQLTVNYCDKNGLGAARCVTLYTGHHEPLISPAEWRNQWWKPGMLPHSFQEMLHGKKT